MGGQNPVGLYFADLQGGGALGVLQVEKIIHLETLTGEPLVRLFDAFYCSSVGAILGAGLLTPDPQRPGQPRYTAKEVGGVFYRNLPRYLPPAPWHYVLQPLNALFRRKSLHYDRTVMVETLPDIFGAGTMMSDLLGTIVIPSGVLGQATPYNFVHFRNGLFSADEVSGHYFSDPEDRQARLDEMSKTLVVTAILASAAAPTVFRSFENPVTGAQHVDLAAVASPRRLIDAFALAARGRAERRKEPLSPLSFVQFGTGKNFPSISSDVYNGVSYLGMTTRLLPELLSMQVHQEDIAGLRAFLGPGHVHILDRPWKETYGPRDILKADSAQVDRLRAYAAEEIEEQRDAYNRLAEGLMDNQEAKRRRSVMPDSVYVKPSVAHEGGNVRYLCVPVRPEDEAFGRIQIDLPRDQLPELRMA